MRRAIELEQFFSVLPAFKGIYHNIDYNYGDILSKNVDKEYNSKIETPLTKKELKEYIHKNNLLGEL